MVVKVKLDGLKKIVKALESREVKKDAAFLVIAEMKSFITRGVSPVKGERRFEGYRDPKKYPGDRKSKRPVNMTLTGSMLDALTYRFVAGSTFTVGWFSGVNAKKAHNHNNGVTVPERRLLPDRRNESFNVSIMRELRNYYAKIISDMIK